MLRLMVPLLFVLFLFAPTISGQSRNQTDQDRKDKICKLLIGQLKSVAWWHGKLLFFAADQVWTGQLVSSQRVKILNGVPNLPEELRPDNRDYVAFYTLSDQRGGHFVGIVRQSGQEIWNHYPASTFRFPRKYLVREKLTIMVDTNNSGYVALKQQHFMGEGLVMFCSLDTEVDWIRLELRFEPFKKCHYVEQSNQTNRALYRNTFWELYSERFKQLFLERPVGFSHNNSMYLFDNQRRCVHVIEHIPLGPLYYTWKNYLTNMTSICYKTFFGCGEDNTSHTCDMRIGTQDWDPGEIITKIPDKENEQALIWYTVKLALVIILCMVLLVISWMYCLCALHNAAFARGMFTRRKHHFKAPKAIREFLKSNTDNSSDPIRILTKSSIARDAAKSVSRSRSRRLRPKTSTANGSPNETATDYSI